MESVLVLSSIMLLFHRKCVISLFHNLYTNTVLDGCVTLSTVPLSAFKTKHIFGIPMERVTFLNHLGRRRRPKFFVQLFYRRRRRRKLS